MMLLSPGREGKKETNNKKGAYQSTLEQQHSIHVFCLSFHCNPALTFRELLLEQVTAAVKLYG